MQVLVAVLLVVGIVAGARYLHQARLGLNWLWLLLLVPALLSARSGAVGVAVTVTVLVLVVGIMAGAHLLKSSRSERENERRLLAATTRRREKLQERARQVNAEYAAYLVDITAVIERPRLSDVRAPETMAWIAAHSDLQGADPDDVERFEELVKEAEKTWLVADASARTAGMGALGSAERRRLEKASSLLGLALGAAATDFERQGAYKQAKKLIEGLIVVPASARERVEHQLRQMLTSQPGRPLPPTQ